MRTFYEKVVARPKATVIIFIALAVLCAGMRQLVAVNYDMNDYLPESSPSTIALNVMEKEFSDGIPNARVMVKDVSVAEALGYKAKLKAVDGVTDVKWLDDAADPAAPVESMDSAITEKYYRSGNALFTLTIDDDKCEDAVAGVRRIIGNDNAMSGAAVSKAIATEGTVVEIRKIAALAVLITILILILATTSWTDPFIILLGIGVAVIINAGTNLVFGEISFVTNAAGSILQLAVTLDYSVFLIHRYIEVREEMPDPREAMIESLCRSTTSILSSGLTTVIGFLALCLMRFRLGPDLGLALAKGIAIGLITVFVFMPCLMLLTNGLTDRTRHRPLMPSFTKLGKAICRITIPMAVAFALILAPSYLASTSNSYYYGASHIYSGKTQAGRDSRAIDKAFGQSDTYALLVPKGSPAKEEQLTDDLEGMRNISSVISYAGSVGAVVPPEYLDADTLSKLESKDYSRLVITVNEKLEGPATFRRIKDIRRAAEKYYPGKYQLAGQGVSTDDLKATVNADMIRVNLIAIAAVFLVLVIIMKSLFMPAILVLSIEAAIWINLSFPYFSDKPIFYIAYLIISSVQLGSTVDYAILLADRYRESRQTLERKPAVIRSVALTTSSILVSGSAMIVTGLLLGYISTHGVLSQLGILVGRGAFCSLMIVIFILPGLLYVCDRLVIRNKRERKNLPFLKKEAAK